MNLMKTILLIRNKSEYSDQIKIFLESFGLRIHFTDSFSSAWELIKELKIQMLLMDTQTHYGNGIEFCAKLRSLDYEGKIVFLSENINEKNILLSLDSGADDYLCLPMSFNEIMARIKKYLPPKSHKTRITFGELLINPHQRILNFMDKYVTLGRKEFDIFYHIVQRRSSIVERRTLLELVYEESDQSERIIDSHISHIRSKLWQLGGPKIQIQSIYGKGYTIIYQD
jgi:DNA-binding response OmpR family regulator